MTREARVAAAQATIFTLLDNRQKEFIEFVLSKYIETGVEELDQDKLPILLTNKYQSLENAKDILGDVANISKFTTLTRKPGNSNLHVQLFLPNTPKLQIFSRLG